MASIPVQSSESRREPAGDREQQLNLVIATYLEALEAGDVPDRAAILAGHPDLSVELATFFANQDHVARLTAPLREGMVPVGPPRAGLLPTGAGRDDGGAVTVPFPGIPGSDSRERTGGADEPGAATTGAAVRYFGDYELIEVIAEGGMGVVFKARQVSLDRVLALKMVRAGRFVTPEDLQRFRLEAAAAAQLDHPHIVPIHEVGEHEGHHYFSMKLVEGGNLAAQVERYAANPRAAARLVATVARAVHYAHERGILHRDLKPANILLGGPAGSPLEERVPIVTDFGLAKRFGGAEAGNLTQSGSIVGTPNYMAPEQADGSRAAITTAADIHALGAILFELLTGAPPFRAGTMLETLRKVREDEPKRPSTLNRRVDRDLETIVLKCLEKPRHRRYRSAEALAEDLERWLAGLPIRARAATLADRTIKWIRRRPTGAALVGTAGVAVVTLGLSGGLLSWTARLRSAVAQKGQALLAERAKRQGVETELAGSRDRKQRMEDELYAKRILAAQQALANDDPVQEDPRLVDRLLDDCPASLRQWEWRYLKRRNHAELLKIQGHSGTVCASDFQPVSGSVRCQDLALGSPIWSTSVGPRVRHIDGPDGSIYGLSFDRTGSRLATAGMDGQIKLWDLTLGGLPHAFRGPPGWAADVAFSEDGSRLASAHEDGSVRIWDATLGPGGSAAHESPLHVLVGHTGGVLGVAFGPDDTKLASSGKDGTVRVWRLDQGPPRAVCVFRGHGQDAWCVSFHPSGKLIASGGADRRVRIWDALTGAERLSFQAAASRVNAIAYSPDGTRLATGSLDGPIGIWNAESGAPIGVLRGHARPVFEVAFKSDGTKLISAAQDASVKLWDLTSQAGVRTLELEASSEASPAPAGAAGSPASTGVRWVGGVAFAPSGRELAAGGTERTVALWEVATGRLKRTLRAPWGAAIALAYTRDGSRLAVAGTDRTVRIWNVGAGGEPVVLSDLREGVASVAFAADGKMVATGGGDCPHVLQEPMDKVPSLEGKARTIHLWDTTTGKMIRSLGGHIGSIHGIAFSPDGTLLASAGADGDVRLWDVATGEVKTLLRGHRGAVFCVAFGPDGKTLAAAGSDHTIRAWDVASGRLIHELAGHANWVFGVAFSRDGMRLASAGADQTVRIWDPVRGRELLILRGPQNRVHGVAFSPDGTRLAAASADGNVWVWETETGATSQ
jgi:WD40 repeat protein